MHHTALPDDLKHNLIKCNAWAYNCPISLERLRLLHITYVNFKGVEHTDGQMVVMDAAADSVLEIFRELHKLNFPLATVKPICFYRGNDDISMEANNSTAFHYRNIANGSTLSIHSYGLAIDINPIQNPYLKTNNQGKDTHSSTILPIQGSEYTDRTNIRAGMVEPIVAIFKKWGFPIWGGEPNTELSSNVIDWHHFQTTRAIAEILSCMSSEHANDFFPIWREHSQTMMKLKSGATTESLKQIYQHDPVSFMAQIDTLFQL